MSHAETKATGLWRPDPYLRCVIPGRVVSKGRPRTRNRSLKFRNDGPHEAWLQKATWIYRSLWRGRDPLVEPLLMVVQLYFERPKRLQRVMDRCTGLAPFANVPDADNAAGLPLDALNRAEIVRDDRQVVDLIVTSRYLALDERGRHVNNERTEIELYPWFGWLDGRPWAG